MLHTPALVWSASSLTVQQFWSVGKSTESAAAATWCIVVIIQLAASPGTYPCSLWCYRKYTHLTITRFRVRFLGRTPDLWPTSTFTFLIKIIHACSFCQAWCFPTFSFFSLSFLPNGAVDEGEPSSFLSCPHTGWLDLSHFFSQLITSI